MLRKTRNRLRNLSNEFIKRLSSGTLPVTRSQQLSVAESLESRTLFAVQTATLIAGGDPAQDNDGALTVTVDPFGGFGHRFAASGAIYNPEGSRRPQETVNDSAIYFGPLGNFLTTDSIITNDSPVNSNPNVSGGTFISQTHDPVTDISTAVSQFIVHGTDGINYQITLTQILTPEDSSGRTTLTQTYQIKNISSTDAHNVVLDHYLSSELDWDAVDGGGIPIDTDTGGESGDGRILFAFDSPNADAAYVSIRNDDPNPTSSINPYYNGEAEFNPNLTVSSHIEEIAKNTSNEPAGTSGFGNYTFLGGGTGGGLERPYNNTFLGDFSGYPSSNPLDNYIDNPTFPNYSILNGNNNLTHPETYWPTILASGGIANGNTVPYHGLVLDQNGNPTFDPTTGQFSTTAMTMSLNDIDTFPADRGAAGDQVDGPFGIYGSESDNHLDDNALKDAGPLSLTTQDVFNTLPAGGTITYTTRTDWGTRSTISSMSPGVFKVVAGNVDEPPGDPSKGATGVTRTITVTRTGSMGVADIGIVSSDLSATSYYPNGAPPDYVPLSAVDPATGLIATDPSTGTIYVDPTTGRASGYTSVHFLDGQTSAAVPITILPDLTIEGDETIQISMYANDPIKTGSGTYFDPSAFVDPTTNQAIGAGTLPVHDSTVNALAAYPTFWNVGQKQEGEPTQFEFTVVHIPANDAPGSVAFQTGAQSVDPRSGTLTLPIIRTGNFDPSAEVSFTYTLSGTAVENVNYGVPYTIDPDTNQQVPAVYDPASGLWTGTGRYAIGSTTTNLTIPLINNPNPGPDLTLVVNLTATAPATNGTPSSDTITLLNKNNYGTFYFDSSSYNVTASATSVTLTVDRISGTDNAVTVPFTINPGSAKAGVDYSDVSGTVSFVDGQTSATVTIPILNPGTPEVAQNFTVTLAVPSFGALGSPSTTTVNIPTRNVTSEISFSNTPTDGGSTVASSTLAVTVREGNPFATLTITRSHDSSTVVTVPYSFVDGTAKNGIDYSGTPGTVTFGVGQTAATVTIPIIDDSIINGTRSFTVTLGTPSGLAILPADGSATSETVSILDNDSSFQFSAPTYSFNENIGTANITVTRVGDTADAVTLNYSTTPGSALANLDYQPVSGVLNFASGQTTATISIPLIDRPLDEDPQRTFSISLSSPIGTFADAPDSGAQLGSPQTASIAIDHVERAHPSVTGLNITSATKGMERVVLTFSKPLDTRSANTPQNYTIAALDSKGKVKKYIRVSAATYNPANDTVTLLPLPHLSSNTVYQVQVKGVNGVMDTGGRYLAASALAAPSDFVGRTAFGSKISYIDTKGNLVTLQTKKGGTIFYNRVNGGDTITILNVIPGVTSLIGNVKAQRGTDGYSIIESLSGTNGLKVLLPGDKFQINNVS